MDSTWRDRVQWGAAIGGALAASALFLVLFGFGVSLGLATGSSAPTWRDASFALWLLSALYLLLSFLVSFALGGYVAGRFRARPLMEEDEAEQEINTGMHGLVVWAIAVLLGALLAAAGARALGPIVSPQGQQGGQMSSLGGENLLAFELDKLFRSDRRPNGEDMTYARSEAGRILLTTSSHRGMLADDRAYLIRLVSGRTGIPGAEAEQRVTAISAQARDSLARARKTGVLMGFATAASLLLGAVVCWFAAQRGERDAYGSDISGYDSMFRISRLGSWFAPPRHRTSATTAANTQRPRI